MFKRNVLWPLKHVVFITLLVLATAVDAQSVPTGDLRASQARACRDTVWQRPEYGAVPKAALVVMYGGFAQQRAWIYWIVDWPVLRAAGKCWLPTDKAEVLEVENFFTQPPSSRTQP